MSQVTANSNKPNPYDVTPYVDLAYAASHPDRLATMARLLRRPVAPVESSRVLEIGSAAGGNLLPMAYSLPNAQFVGLDYSIRQIEEGQRRVAQLGLDNVRLVCADLGAMQPEFEGELGSFDYFIAHGFYSWTPPAVRNAMLALCKRVLRPEGVAYISYNTYPGWYRMKMIRDAMLYHGQNAGSPEEMANQGREMVNFIAQYANEGLHKNLFRHYSEMLENNLKGTDNSFLLHDELSEVNDPVYFYQFVEHAMQFGLQYMVEVELRSVMVSSFKPETQAALNSMARDAVDLEQKMDFVRDQMFRQSLLRHAGEPAALTISPKTVMETWLRSSTKRLSSVDEQMPAGSVQFVSRDDSTVTTNHPLSIAALEVLAKAWPRALYFKDLVGAASEVLVRQEPSQAAPTPQDELTMAATLLQAHCKSLALVEIHSFHPQVLNKVTNRPMASKMARFEAQTRHIVTNLWHDRVTLSPLQQEIIVLLDGSHSIEAIGGMFEGKVTQKDLEDNLRFFAFAALLIA